MNDINTLIKWCKHCGENTERVGVSKRCKPCRDRLAAAARERQKTAAEADPAVAKQQREAAAERSRKYYGKKRAELASMTYAERFHYEQERAAARRARKEYSHE